MDRARSKTDKQLKEMERKIAEIYSSSLALRRISKKYSEYMKSVSKDTKELYDEYDRETNISQKAVLKKEYKSKIRSLTVENKVYRGIVSEFARVLAGVNQQALDVVNKEMAEIYALNYNQTAVDCKKVGIKVDGEESK